MFDFQLPVKFDFSFIAILLKVICTLSRHYLIHSGPSFRGTKSDRLIVSDKNCLIAVIYD